MNRTGTQPLRGDFSMDSYASASFLFPGRFTDDLLGKGCLRSAELLALLCHASFTTMLRRPTRGRVLREFRNVGFAPSSQRLERARPREKVFPLWRPRCRGLCSNLLRIPRWIYGAETNCSAQRNVPVYACSIPFEESFLIHTHSLGFATEKYYPEPCIRAIYIYPRRQPINCCSDIRFAIVHLWNDL